jgi:hypothetical protein
VYQMSVHAADVSSGPQLFEHQAVWCRLDLAISTSQLGAHAAVLWEAVRLDLFVGFERTGAAQAASMPWMLC